MSLCAGCGAVIVVDAEGNGLCVACEAALAGGGCGWPEVDEIGAAEVTAAGEVGVMACFIAVTVREIGKQLFVNMDLITSMHAEDDGACLWRSGAEIHVWE